MDGVTEMESLWVHFSFHVMQQNLQGFWDERPCQTSVVSFTHSINWQWVLPAEKLLPSCPTAVSACLLFDRQVNMGILPPCWWKNWHNCWESCDSYEQNRRRTSTLVIDGNVKCTFIITTLHLLHHGHQQVFSKSRK